MSPASVAGIAGEGLDATAAAAADAPVAAAAAAAPAAGSRRLPQGKAERGARLGRPRGGGGPAHE